MLLRGGESPGWEMSAEFCLPYWREGGGQRGQRGQTRRRCLWGHSKVKSLNFSSNEMRSVAGFERIAIISDSVTSVLSGREVDRQQESLEAVSKSTQGEEAVPAQEDWGCGWVCSRGKANRT